MKWVTSTAAFKSSIVVTYIARSLKIWLEEMEDNLKSKAPGEQTLVSLTVLMKSADTIDQMLPDAIRLSARATALLNSARRAIWLCSWSGDEGSKSRLSSIACESYRLFGTGLDNILEKVSSITDSSFGAKNTYPQEPGSRENHNKCQNRDRKIKVLFYANREGSSRTTQWHCRSSQDFPGNSSKLPTSVNFPSTRKVADPDNIVFQASTSVRERCQPWDF